MNGKFVCKDDVNFRWKNWTVPSRSFSSNTKNCQDHNNTNTSNNTDTHEEKKDTAGRWCSRFLQVSNDTCPPPEGLTAFHDFLSQEEATQLYAEILDHEFQWEGFEQRRRVQRHEIPPLATPSNGGHPKTEGTTNGTAANCGAAADEADSRQSTVPKTMYLLLNRLASATGHWPQHVSVEEYVPQNTLKVMQYGSKGYNQVVTNLETTNSFPCTCTTKSNSKEQSLSLATTTKEQKCNHCSSFVAQLPLKGGSVVKHLNKPKRRHNTCFDLESAKHWTDIRLDERNLLLQTGDCIWDWRGRISALPLVLTPADVQEQQKAAPSLVNTDAPLLVLKIYRLPPDSSTDNNHQSTPNPGSRGVESWNFDDFGYIRTPETSYRRDAMPPLEEILTIIVTTSPIKSNPSTEILERSFGTFSSGGRDFALKCRKVIVCDGFRVVDDKKEKVSRRHANIKQAMRNGICTSDQADSYHQFKVALRELCVKATSGSPFYNTKVEELDSRHGYGFALRHALRHCVTTPYVCVVQHDRSFMRPTPVEETLRAMWHHRYIKYVTMSMRSNLTYRDQFQGKYGKTYYDEFDDMILRLPELNLDKTQYGPDSSSTQNIRYDNDKVRNSMLGVMSAYRGSKQNVNQLNWLKENPPTDPDKHQLTLTPTLFWYDNVHIVETEHYRDFVFNPLYKMVKKGGFVEDKLSPLLTRTLERLGLREGHSRFGCYILDDHSGLFFTGHFDGGSYVAKAKREAQRNQYSKESTTSSS